MRTEVWKAVTLGGLFTGKKHKGDFWGENTQYLGMAGGYMGAYGNIWLHTSAVRVLSAGYGTIKSFLEKKKESLIINDIDMTLLILILKWTFHYSRCNYIVRHSYC